MGRVAPSRKWKNPGKVKDENGKWVDDPTYGAWRSMRARAKGRRMEPKRAKERADPPGMDSRWEDFDVFVGDLGPCPGRGWSLERRDNSLRPGYTKANCYWVEKDLQQRNTTRTRLVTHKSVTLPTAEMAREWGISRLALTNRLDRGWDVGTALSYPVNESPAEQQRRAKMMAAADALEAAMGWPRSSRQYPQRVNLKQAA